MTVGFIKGNRTKQSSPHIFSYSQNLVEKCQIEIIKIEFERNVEDMLTKALPTHKHKKLVCAAGMKLLQKIISS